MQHDYSDPDYCKALEDLFKPGNGISPPTLAGRDEEQALLGGYLGTAQGETDPDGRLLSRIPHDVVLYGPRGNGKTVLLDAFAGISRALAAKAHVVELRPKLLHSPADMAGLLLHNDDDAMAGLLEKARPDVVTLGLPGFAKADWKALSMADKDSLRVRHLQGLLSMRCRDRPLIVTVDEAHTLDINMGATLLNLSEALRKRGARFLLVLAGTPNLESHLTQMNATFWGRSKVLPIGRLDEAATRAALENPLKGLSVEFDPDALDRVVEDSQRYPYFIQIWGKALCDVLVKAKQGRIITAALAEEAAPAAARQRDGYYAQRYRETEDQGLLAGARALAGRFGPAKTPLSRPALWEALTAAGVAKDEGRAKEDFRALADLGYVWCQPDSVMWEPGIPSLMDYVLENANVQRNDGGGKPGGP